ncbi:MAG TPA: hypothetical protein VH598_02770 [Verrucomicrobiae bacterium]|jgi:hypothetical protein|nr:hypothetical protein [Verrucomicrobiae bacterium]
MNTSTHTLPLSASKEKAFAFLSKIENLPKWATLFCKQLKLDGQGNYKVVTPDGEIFFQIEADARTGVIDMYGGPALNQLAYWPARVVDRPGHGSLFIFTAMQYPGVSDEQFRGQCAGLEGEFTHIRACMEKD